MKRTINLYAIVTASCFLSIWATAPVLSSDADREQVKTNFLQSDINQDEHLDFDEFTTFINLNAEHGIGRAAMIRRLGMHERAFARLDINADGMVSKEELRTAASQQ